MFKFYIYNKANKLVGFTKANNPVDAVDNYSRMVDGDEEEFRAVQMIQERKAIYRDGKFRNRQSAVVKCQCDNEVVCQFQENECPICGMKYSLHGVELGFKGYSK